MIVVMSNRGNARRRQYRQHGVGIGLTRQRLVAVE